MPGLRYSAGPDDAARDDPYCLCMDERTWDIPEDSAYAM